jgi:hypothetical protein
MKRRIRVQTKPSAAALAIVTMMTLACLLPNVQGASYSFINIADSSTAAPSGTFTGIWPYVAVSGRRVAFQGFYSGGEGVFVGAGGPLTAIAKTGDVGPLGEFTVFSSPSIDGSDVAFSAGYSGGSAVFIDRSGALIVVAKTGDVVPSTGLTFGSFFANNFGPPALSGGMAAFTGYYGSGVPNYDNGVFRGSGGALTAIAKASDVNGGSGESIDKDVAISGNTAAFSNGRGVYAGSGGPITHISHSVIGGSFPLEPPSISGDTVAFFAVVTDKPELAYTVFARNGESLETVATTGDELPAIGVIDGASAPSISGATIAFTAYSWRPATSEQLIGLFVRTGAGPIEAVITKEDPLFGSTLTDVRLGPFGLDAGGSESVAFYYELADGRRGVALAYVIPEPSTLAIVVLTVVLAPAIARRTLRDRYRD